MKTDDEQKQRKAEIWKDFLKRQYNTLSCDIVYDESWIYQYGFEIKQ